MEFNPAVDFKLLLAVPLIPLIGYAIQIFFGRHLPRKGDWLLTSGMFVVMLITVWMAIKAIVAAYRGDPFFHESAVLSAEEGGMSYGWFYGAYEQGQNVVAGLLYDPLGAAMLAVVGIVSFFVHLFSMGYMHGDRRYHIFFANISLFTFAMLGLTLSDNILFLFIFWELMGLMSYLLIGHFSHDPDSPRITHAAAACKKAFLTTRVGDVCLFIGFMMFYLHYETFRFTELWEAVALDVADNGGRYEGWMTVAGLFIFGGTVGKSAQFPLHIWLPDAMEGPTPVSAMIHAATMVAAGVFLLGRTYPMLSPEVLAVVATVGTFTALFAATIGLTVNDIKGVLAYSTISQLGFMVAAVGCGGVVAGMFHMVTHAFFKSCLFLSAGSVIHGCHHEQDMRKMGGLRKMMPLTFLAMFVSTLAIAGVPGFSGFFSKDMVLMAAFENYAVTSSGAALFASIGLPLAAALTAFYMFRLIFMTFFGEYRGGHDDHGHGHDDHGHGDDHGGHDDHGHGHTPHESPRPMTISLLVLALLGFLGAGVLFASGTHWFPKSTSVERMYPNVVADMAHLDHEAAAVAEYTLHHGKYEEGATLTAVQETAVQKTLAHGRALKVSLLVASLGIFFAFLIYHRRTWDPADITRRLGLLYTTVRDKYHVDEIVNATVIKLTMLCSTLLKLFDQWVVDGLVNLVGRTNKSLGFVSASFDLRVVDGLVNASALVTQALGAVLRLFQTGRIQQYAAFAVGGGLLTAAWLILS